MKELHIQVSENWLAEVRKYAKEKGLTVSAFIRLVVSEYMKREG